MNERTIESAIVAMIIISSSAIFSSSNHCYMGNPYDTIRYNPIEYDTIRSQAFNILTYPRVILITIMHPLPCFVASFFNWIVLYCSLEYNCSLYKVYCYFHPTTTSFQFNSIQ